MPADTENVRLTGKTGSDLRKVEMTRLTRSSSGRVAQLLMNCAQAAQRRRRDVKKCANRSRHVSRGWNNEMNRPRKGLELAQ
jgi:hypothetical protein